MNISRLFSEIKVIQQSNLPPKEKEAKIKALSLIPSFHSNIVEKIKLRELRK